MKLLLHICCGPCLIYPLGQLRLKGFEVEGLFYNPNIHPFSEYEKRREAVENFSRTVGVVVRYPEYKPEEFFQAVSPLDKNRCSLCWQLRLKKTAEVAKQEGFGCFSSTLLVSPHQNQEILKKIGDKAAEAAGVNFHYEDFRPGFRQAHQEARGKGMYCQKYCGCVYSKQVSGDTCRAQTSSSRQKTSGLRLSAGRQGTARGRYPLTLNIY